MSGPHDVAGIQLEKRPLTVSSLPNITEGLGTALADRYRLERELGAGGMAMVYLADDLKQAGGPG